MFSRPECRAGERRNPNTHYLSYLLRLWRVKDADEDAWRASLHSPQTGRRISFRSLDELFVFLRRETGRVPDSDAAEGPGVGAQESGSGLDEIDNP